MGVPVERSLTQFGTVREVEGRYSRVSFAGHQVRLLLAKNPAGWIEALNQVDGEAGPIVLAVNANSADGTDPSWLWDVPFEQLRGRTVVASGVRAWDVAVRLTYAEVAHEVEPDVSAAIRLLPPGPCDVLANYTAFVTTRAALARAS
jgi:UDP-N-acetylmuramyl tripeptide synthase